MAKQGTFAAYQQLKPVQDLSPTLQYWNQVDMAEKQLQERQAQRQAQEDARLQARRDRLLEQYEFTNLGTTGLQTLDAKIAGVASLLDREHRNLLQIADEAIMSGNRNAERDARLKMGHLRSLPEQLKVTHDIITSKVGEYQKLLSEGKIWPIPEFDRLSEDGFKDVQILLDENNNIVVVFEDTDGDGKKTLSDTVYTYDQITRELPNTPYIPRVDVNAKAESHAKVAATATTTRPSGWMQDEMIKQADEDKLEEVANGYYFNPDGSLTDQAISHTIELGLDPTIENAIKAKEIYKGLVRSRISTELKITTDRTNQRLWAQQQKEQENKLLSLEVATGPDGIATEALDNNTTGYVFTFNDGKPITLREQGNTKEIVSNLIIDDKGNVYADVVFEETGTFKDTDFSGPGVEESSTRKKVADAKRVKLTGTDLSNVARQKKNDQGNFFRDGKELSDFMLNRLNTVRGGTQTQEQVELSNNAGVL